jgi:hypothetical protein
MSEILETQIQAQNKEFKENAEALKEQCRSSATAHQGSGVRKPAWRNTESGETSRPGED